MKKTAQAALYKLSGRFFDESQANPEGMRELEKVPHTSKSLPGYMALRPKSTSEGMLSGGLLGGAMGGLKGAFMGGFNPKVPGGIGGGAAIGAGLGAGGGVALIAILNKLLEARSKQLERQSLVSGELTPEQVASHKGLWEQSRNS